MGNYNCYNNSKDDDKKIFNLPPSSPTPSAKFGLNSPLENDNSILISSCNMSNDIGNYNVKYKGKNRNGSGEKK
jgi:hypothetical protein